MKVMNRLQNITALQTLLETTLAGWPPTCITMGSTQRCEQGPSEYHEVHTALTPSDLLCAVSVSPGYIPPLANFDGDASEAVSVPTSSAQPSRAKKGEGKDTRGTRRTRTHTGDTPGTQDTNGGQTRDTCAETSSLITACSVFSTHGSQ